MASVCFYFQVHQPFRLRRYSVFDTDRHYFDEYKNAEICRKVAQRCYLPANKLMLENIKMHEGRFRIAYSISGVAIEQFEQFAPEVMETFQELNATGCVEFLDETYYHSLAFLYSRDEFRAQVDMHRKLMKRLFNQEPRVFRNTELIYNNDLAHFVSHMGYDAILAEQPETEQLAGEAPDPAQLVVTSELGHHLSAGLAALPPDQRAVVILCDVQGYGYAEAAEVERTNIGTIKSRLSRGRARLRDWLAERPELLPPSLRSVYMQEKR